MAKRASLTSGLSGLASQKPASVPAVSKAKPAEVTDLIHDPRQGDIEQATKAATKGRPRTLPDGVKTLSVRVSDDVRKALRQASLDHDIPMQEILMNGILDQLAKLAR